MYKKIKNIVNNRKTRLFNRSSFEHLLSMQDYIDAVEQAHRLHAQNNIISTVHKFINI